MCFNGRKDFYFFLSPYRHIEFKCAKHEVLKRTDINMCESTKLHTN